MRHYTLIFIVAVFCASGLFAENPESLSFNHEVLIGPTQMDLNYQAKKEYLRADEKLNEYYGLINELYSGNPVFLEKLQKAQRLWIQFRDAEIESIFPEIVSGQNIYGSSYPMCYFIELSNITWKRVIELKSFISRTDGDVCNGVRGIYNIEDLILQ